MGIPQEDMIDIEEAIAQHQANLEGEAAELGAEVVNG